MPQSNKDFNYNIDHSNIPENIDASADDLLLDDILREFGDARKKEDRPSAALDDEVAKILQSVQDSLDFDTPDNPDEVITEEIPSAQAEESINHSQTHDSQKPVSSVSKQEEKPSDPDSPRQTVKVVSEDDSSTIFGDNFAKYFGPEAGLAARIEVPGTAVEETDSEPPRKKGLGRLFSRGKKHHDEDYIDGEEAEEGISDESPESEPEENETDRRSRRRRKHAVSAEAGEAYAEPDESEDINPDEAAKSLIEEMGLIRLKLLVGSILSVLLVYVTVAPKLGIFIPDFLTYVRNPYLYLFLTSALLILVMIMCVETVAVGFRDLLTLKPNMESVAALSCLLSAAHSISILAFPQWEGYYPYSAVSALSILFAAYYRQKLKMARLRAYKTVSAMSKPYLVVCEKGVNGGIDSVVKYKAAQPRFFVNQCQRRDAASKAWSYAAPLLIILAIVCAAVSSFGNGQPQRFLWNLSALVAAAAPFSLCLPFSLPFAKATKHLGMMGEAIAGWSAAEDLSYADSLIVTDTDLFPPGSITLNGLKIFGGYAVDKVISYSASLIAASGAGTSKPFLDLLHDQAASLRKVTGFKHYENGGIGGEINGESVIAGSSSFMLRTGIRIPRDINLKNAIYIAINQELAGIFAVNYNTQSGVKKAVSVLRKNGITPVLAIRDFNITPSMIESKFNISTDTADFPPIEDRLALSNPDRIYIAKPAAVISREGLGHYTECVVCARNLRKTTRTCLVITFASVIIGMLLMFYFMFTHAPVQASPANLLAYMGFWLIPNLIAAGWVKM